MSAPSSTLNVLVENRRAFLAYLQRRTGDWAAAEDILQESFAKVLARPEQAPKDEAAVPWFYRVLRNALIDDVRRRGAASRAVEVLASEVSVQEPPGDELTAEACRCVSRIAGTLRPEYSEALQAIDVGGMPVGQFALSRGISASNAGVRVFRARQALRKRLAESCGACAERGCFDCTCGTPA